MCVQGVQYEADDTTLGRSCVQGEGLEVCLSTLMTWGLAVKKPRIQAHRGVFRPNSISLSASLRGTMVLKAELKSINNILTYLLTVEMRESAVYYVGDSIACGSVWPVGELQRVHGGR